MIVNRVRARWRVATFICHPLELFAVLTVAVFGAVAVATSASPGPYFYPITLVVTALAVVGSGLRRAWVGCALWAGLLTWLITDGPLLLTLPSLLPAPFW